MNYGVKEKTIGLMPIVAMLSFTTLMGFGVLYWFFGRGI